MLASRTLAFGVHRLLTVPLQTRLSYRTHMLYDFIPCGEATSQATQLRPHQAVSRVAVVLFVISRSVVLGSKSSIKLVAPLQSRAELGAFQHLMLPRILVTKDAPGCLQDLE